MVGLAGERVGQNPEAETIDPRIFRGTGVRTEARVQAELSLMVVTY